MATLYPSISVVDADGQPVTSDADNLSLIVITDGVASGYAGDITEIADGEYEVEVTQAGALQSVIGTSSTSGAIVVPARWQNHSAAGSGDHTVIITVVDGDGNPVGSCPVRVLNDGGQAVGYAQSDTATGQAGFALNAGTYAAYVGPLPGYITDNPYVITVTGDASETIAIAAVSVPPAPTLPDVCAVYLDTVYTHGDNAGQAVAAGDASIQYIRTVAAPAGMGVALADPDDVAQSDGSGRCTMNLLRGSIVDLMVNLVGVKPRRIQITVPDQDTYDLSEAL